MVKERGGRLEHGSDKEGRKAMAGQTCIQGYGRCIYGIRVRLGREAYEMIFRTYECKQK